MKVLFAENEDAFRQTWAAVLRRWEYEVEECRSQAQAEQLVAQCGDEFDIALLDMRMEHDDSGLQLVMLLGERWPDVPAVVLTAYGELDNVRECMEAGAFSYVSKERAPEILENTLRQAAARRELLRAAPRMWEHARKLCGDVESIENQVRSLKTSLLSFVRELGWHMRMRKTPVEKSESHQE